MNLLTAGLGCLVEVLYPEKCAWCGASFGNKPWASCLERVTGLRPWDRPHACQDCLSRSLAYSVVHQKLAGDLPVSGLATHAELVRVVRDWKYHGVRGLAWPLSQMLGRVFEAILPALDSTAVLVPVPLHRRRQRERGFNQAALLCSLLGEATGVPVADGLVWRRRNTPQQAKIQDPGQRIINVDAAFVCGRQGGPLNVLLVDDLVTTGATVCALSNSLGRAGHQVLGAICLGLARGSP